MTQSSFQFAQSYASTFRRHCAAPSEETLHRAYELGRQAVAAELTILDIAALHHDVLLTMLRDGRWDAEHVTHAAADLIGDTLSAYEMLRRSAPEARAAAIAQRRQAALLRRLSSFLADASLAAANEDALEEVVQLVAEHARELTDAEGAVATCAADGRRWIEAMSCASSDVREVVAAIAARPVETLIGHAATRRIARAELPREAAPGAGVVGSVCSVLIARITTLDRRPVGVLHLVDTRRSEFSEADEAVATHVAEIVGAAIERIRLYQRR